MNSAVFLQVARLSLTAGWMILVLLALRPLLKKAPRRFSCLLWGLVAVRLALPFSFESRVSMVPQAAAAPQKIAQALNPGQVMWVNPAALAANPLPAAEAAAPVFSPASLIPLVWGLGIAAMLLYAAISYFRLYRQVQVSAPAGKRVYRCDTISTPFILGIVNPKIFLPSDLDERTAVSVLAHEQAHLRRGDHLWKPLGYVLLSIYWFNPLCWVAYFLFCRDVEQACDEAVIERMDTQQKKDYSAALLACAAPNRIQVCPLAFAEVGVKQRIAGVLNYRKPKFWVVALAALLCVSLTAGLLTDPVKATKAEDNTQQTLPTETEISTTVGVPLNVRSEPTLNAPAIAMLETGTQIQILRTQSVDGIIWAYVSADTLKENGWVMATYLNTVEGETLPTVSADVTHGSPSNASGDTVTVTTKGAVDLYASPTVQGRVVFQLEDGSPVTILRIDSIGQQSWAYVQSVDLDRPGWILVDSLNTESIDLSIYDAAPVATPTVPLPAQLSSSILTEEIPATTKGTVDLYASPTVQGRVVFQLEDSSPVTILRIDSIGQQSWAYVQSVDLDRPGWIPLDSLNTDNVDLSIYTTPVTYPTMQSDGINITEETSATTKEALTLYTSPSLNARTKGELAQGESVTIIRIDSIGQSVWTYIRSDTLNATGWVLADSFDIDGDTLSIPSAKDMELMRVFAEKERDSNSYRDHIDKLDEIIADYISKNGTSQVLTEGTPAIAKENLNVRQAPSVQSKAVGLLLKGEQVTVLRTDLFENVSWSYVQYGTEKRVGWVLSEYLTADDSIAQDGPLSLTAALEYFQRYIQAIALDTPDKAEGFLYFATEYSREFFRDNYAPVTGWDITAISQLADDLCCIAWSSPSSTDYAFVGQMDGRLYVFRTVHELPEHWKAGLDVAQYEQENAMYMTEALLECYAVTKRLMDFAQPVQVKITQKDGWKPAETPWELDFADAVCGTDTWHFTQEISDKTPQCTILLTAEDGSTARLWDVDGTVLITHPDGTQEICIADFQGEATYEGSSLLSTVYQWATNLA